MMSQFSAFSQDFSKFIGKDIDAVANFQFNQSQFYEYARYSENSQDSVIVKLTEANTSESVLIAKYADLFLANKDSVVNQLVLISKLSLQLYHEEYIGIKYQTIQKQDTSKIAVFLIQKVRNNFSLVSKENQISEIITTTLQLKTEILSQFEYEEPSSKYEQLKPIAKAMKDLDGTLNLGKLSKYLKTKPKELEKYCDF